MASQIHKDIAALQLRRHYESLENKRSLVKGKIDVQLIMSLGIMVQGAVAIYSLHRYISPRQRHATPISSPKSPLQRC